MEFLIVVFERFVAKTKSESIEEKGEDFIETTRESLFRTGVSVIKELCFAKTKNILEESSNSRTNSKVPPDCKQLAKFCRRYDIDFTNLHGEAGGLS
eukprot:scaffold1365_cov163-Ochromonas_danica.AAC.25